MSLTVKEVLDFLRTELDKTDQMAEYNKKRTETCHNLILVELHDLYEFLMENRNGSPEPNGFELLQSLLKVIKTNFGNEPNCRGFIESLMEVTEKHFGNLDTNLETLEEIGLNVLFSAENGVNEADIMEGEGVDAQE